MQKFTVVIEDWKAKTIREVHCEGEEIPDLLVDKHNKFYVRKGKYASPGNRYMYHPAIPVSF